MYVDKRDTFSSKWDENKDEHLSFTVADMDFDISAPIKKAIANRNDPGLYSYTYFSQEAKTAIQTWIKQEHQIQIEEDWILFVPRVSHAFYAFLNAFTQKDEKVLIPVPSYGPLYHQIIANDRQTSHIFLNKDDFSLPKNIEIEEKTRTMLLINPHNPSGRVWKEKELQKIFQLAKDYNLSLFVDELHSDFIRKGQKHYNVLQAYPDQIRSLVYVNSLSKTFNIPGLMLAYTIIPDRKTREAMQEELHKIGIHNPPAYANEVFMAAYYDSKPWLEKAKQAIMKNEQSLRQRLASTCPKIKVRDMESTYMCLLDFSNFKMSNEEIRDWFEKDCRVHINMADDFITNFDHQVRINLATSLENVMNLCEAMSKNYSKLK